MPDDPSAKIVPFGKHKGLTVAELLERDPSYAQWLLGQGWLAQRFAELHAAILSRGANPDDSPEHNRIQAQFLNPTFQAATLLAAIPERLQKSKTNEHNRITLDRQNRINQAITNCDALTYTIETYKNAEPPSWTFKRRNDASARLPQAEADILKAKAEALKPMPPLKTNAKFEANGIDVFIQWSFDGDLEYHHPGIGIEIKPALGDDYPTVMRQMRRLETKVLVIDQYNSNTLPLSTVREMFKNNGQILLTIQEIIDQIPNAKNSMGNSA